jgi:APA family basic amino acid/polyamine antiporter
MPRPYRAVGYPVIPIIFVLVAIALILSTLQKSPRESLLGLGIMATGIPFFMYWKRK